MSAGDFFRRKKGAENGDESDVRDICSLYTTRSKRCHLQDGEMKCTSEERVYRHCPGQPPELVQHTTKEEDGDEMGAGSSQDPFLDAPDIPSIAYDIFDAMSAFGFNVGGAWPRDDMHLQASARAEESDLDVRRQMPANEEWQTVGEEDPFALRDLQHRKKKGATTGAL